MKRKAPLKVKGRQRESLMGGRLPAVAGMPANRTFLEMSAGQSDWPEKICVVLLPKKRRRPVSFRHKEKRFSPWTAPWVVCTTKVKITFYVAAGIPEFSAFNSIARRPKSALRLSVKVHLRCAYHPLSQHIKRSLPSDIHYFPFALVNYSVTPTLTYFRPR